MHKYKHCQMWQYGLFLKLNHNYIFKYAYNSLKKIWIVVKPSDSPEEFNLESTGLNYPSSSLQQTDMMIKYSGQDTTNFNSHI